MEASLRKSNHLSALLKKKKIAILNYAKCMQKAKSKSPMG